jgi:2TM domain
MTDEGDLRERAIASLKKKREFPAHLLAYVLVNVFLVAIWAVTSDGGTSFGPSSRSSDGASDSCSTRGMSMDAPRERSRSTTRWNDFADPSRAVVRGLPSDPEPCEMGSPCCPLERRSHRAAATG